LTSKIGHVENILIPTDNITVLDHFFNLTKKSNIGLVRLFTTQVEQLKCEKGQTDNTI